MSYRVKARFDDVSVTITTDSDNPLDLDDIARVATSRCAKLNAELTGTVEVTISGLSHREAMQRDYLLGDE